MNKDKKKKKPDWKRQQHHLKRLKKKWRRPKGTHSKMRKKVKGRGKMPNIGYKNPEEIRGKHPSGYFPVLVHNVKELKEINPKKEAAIIAKIGEKKREKILKEADKMKIRVLNK